MSLRYLKRLFLVGFIIGLFGTFISIGSAILQLIFYYTKIPFGMYMLFGMCVVCLGFMIMQYADPTFNPFDKEESIKKHL